MRWLSPTATLCYWIKTCLKKLQPRPGLKGICPPTRAAANCCYLLLLLLLLLLLRLLMAGSSHATGRPPARPTYCCPCSPCTLLLASRVLLLLLQLLLNAEDVLPHSGVRLAEGGQLREHLPQPQLQQALRALAVRAQVACVEGQGGVRGERSV